MNTYGLLMASRKNVDYDVKGKLRRATIICVNSRKAFLKADAVAKRDGLCVVETDPVTVVQQLGHNFVVCSASDAGLAAGI